MSEAKKFYVCEICGSQIEIIEDGGGEIVCCGEPMVLLNKSCETAKNKEHDLIIEEIPGGMKVQIGNGKPHPMSAGHFIQWIECWIGNHVFRKHLKPDNEPTAEFMIEEWIKSGETPRFRTYCNVHGMRYCPNCEKNQNEHSEHSEHGEHGQKTTDTASTWNHTQGGTDSNMKSSWQEGTRYSGEAAREKNSSCCSKGDKEHESKSSCCAKGNSYENSAPSQKSSAV
ncbi:MAG: desulfoferrodoxin FeS4 iron-binding domain-containing protein [Planctomycetaceae bacterium]|nr:desulfoferrodoxin FeS4 iron-binding domain-containing protein [Planctomycetaceae bacterium]